MGYERKYSFSGYQANNPARPLPAVQLDAELDAIGTAFDQTLDAYGVARANGFQGNVIQWLASLKGDKGDRGAQGDRGPAGTPGAKGDQGAQGIQGPRGDQGPQGAQGSKGDAGAQGFQGPQGDRGPQGLVGPKGDQGLQGLQGVKGDTGSTGVRGPAGTDGANGTQGPKGDTGAQGAAGPKGDQGLQGVQGAKGDQGVQGVKGDQGAGVVIKGSVPTPADLPASGNTPGDTYIMTSSGSGYAAGDGYAFTGNGFTNVGQIRGPQGVQGPAGTAGAAGAQGIQGPAGAAGAAGPKGDQGIQGIQGPAGAKGDTGAAGAKGDQGIQGPAGAAGVQGPAGTAGAQGAKGDTGAAGAQGIQGLKGDQGIQGPQGVAGAKGDQGIQGPQGPAGSLGFTPVQQGTGPGQGSNTVAIGWGGDKNAIGEPEAILKGSVDGVDLGAVLSDYSLGGGNSTTGRLNRLKAVKFFGSGIPGSHYCEIASSGPGPIGNSGFVRIGAGSVVLDPEGLFDVNNFWYNCAESGTYLINATFRPVDGSGAYEWGYGIDTAEQDGPFFKWDYRPGVGRWVGDYTVIRHLKLHDQLRAICYGYYPPSFDRVAWRIALIKPD